MAVSVSNKKRRLLRGLALVRKFQDFSHGCPWGPSEGNTLAGVGYLAKRLVLARVNARLGRS